MKPFVPTYFPFDQSKIRLQAAVLSRGNSIHFFYFPNNVLLLVHEVRTPEIYIIQLLCCKMNSLACYLEHLS